MAPERTTASTSTLELYQNAHKRRSQMTTPVQLPARYIAAKQALAEVRRIDEVKDLRDQALAIEVYAFQAKDGELAADAIEIRKRAERRIGELMAERRAADKLDKGGRPR